MSQFGLSKDAVRVGATNENQWSSEAVRSCLTHCVCCVWHFIRLPFPLSEIYSQAISMRNWNSKWKKKGKPGPQPCNKHVRLIYGRYKEVPGCHNCVRAVPEMCKQLWGSLTCKLQAGSAAEDGPPRVEGRALVHPGVLVLVQVANDQAAPRHVTPVVIPQINECSV